MIISHMTTLTNMIIISMGHVDGANVLPVTIFLEASLTLWVVVRSVGLSKVYLRYLEHDPACLVEVFLRGFLFLKR